MEPQGVPAPGRNDQPLAPGTILGGRYEIVEATGEAAFGTLYRANTRGEGRIVTVEVLDPRQFSDARLRGVVRQELEQIGQPDQKNLALPIDFGEERLPAGSFSYVVLEHLDGQSLADMHEKKRAQGKPFTLKGAFNVVAHLANALSVLHELPVDRSGGGGAGWFHGGISMRSIHISGSGRVKLLEIGVARAVLTAGARGALAAAVPTLAPELHNGPPEQIDRRADVFAVGALLYELLTGREPTSPPAPTSGHVAGLPHAIDAFLDKCLRPNPGERFSDMNRLKESLQNAAADGAVEPDAKNGARVLSSAPAPDRTSAPPPKPPASRSGPSLPPASRSAPSLPAQSRSAPSMPAATPGPGGVPKSFNVDSAPSSIDESHERWLIQKDKLDFGPFNLRDLKAQIEAGKVLGEHTIVDSESGERRRVKDHPHLRELAMAAETQHAENERVRIESADRNKHRGRVVTLLGLFVLIAAGAGGGIFWYVQHLKPKVVVVKETVESDLKFDISMKVDPPEKKTGVHKTHAKGTGKNAFDDTQVLGDASEGGGDETLDGATVQRVMTQNFKVLVGCVKEEKSRNSSLHTVDMDFIIKGTGAVGGVKVNGQTTGAFASCMYGKMQTVTFPKFNGSKTHASFSLSFK